MGSEVSEGLRRTVSERAYHVCEYCLIHEEDTFWGFHVDHIISRKHDGTTETGNLAWACACCNANKGSDVGTLIGEPPQLVQLFHPRLDHWAECFSLNGVRLQGLNPSGQATERLLRLNEPGRLGERAALAAAGRYPTIEALARMKD